MANNTAKNSNLIDLSTKRIDSKKNRKKGINKGRDGSVRNINGKVYVDFMYIGERVRERTGLKWNDENEKFIRKKLDLIVAAIESGSFIFSETFPNSKNKQHFTELEHRILGRKKRPEQVLFKDYIWEWYNIRKQSELISGRTLNGYKGYMEKYLIPFFGEIPFGEFNKATFEKFIGWTKKQKYRGKSVGNESIKKYFVVLRMVCKDATFNYGWVGSYDPFIGFKMPKGQEESYEKIYPFNIDEQEKILELLSEHWKPYFDFAFASGVSQGEQRAIKPRNIDWERQVLSIESAITLDENGQIIEGPCKNKFRRRKIRLSNRMINALTDQLKIYEQFSCKYFFCNELGSIIDPSNLRVDIWIPALKEAKLDYRDMRQTRHSFATYHLSKGTDPLTIAKVLGHRNAEMVLKVYAKYIDDGAAIED